MKPAPVHSSRKWLAVAALLLVHYALAVGSKFQQSTTSDELVHLTGGFAFNQLHDYRLHPENGILPQRLAALPAVLMGSTFPSLEQTPWRKSNSWVMGYQFFYAQPGQDHFPRLMAGRALIALFSVATGALVFYWSRSFFGTTGAFVSLAFFVFCPTFLAHGALATSDVCMAFCMLASVGAWWRHLHDGRTRWWWLSATAFSLACVAKFSAPLLLPMFVALALVRLAGPQPLVRWGRAWTTPAGKLAAATLSALGQAAVAVFAIWLFFGFRYAAFNPALPSGEDFIRPWQWLDENLGTMGQWIRTIAAARLLPEGYLYGLAYVLETAQVRSAFLNGEYSITGWPTFFLWAFALKTPLALIAGCMIAVALAIRRTAATQTVATEWHATVYRWSPLLVLFVVYWTFSITSRLNIGHRHILPIYPVLFIACGALGHWISRRRTLLAIVPVGLLGLQAAESIRSTPHFLGYFNVLAGQPVDRHRHLVDSSLDWGQDLPGLKSWLETRAPQERAVFLSYFGTGEPDYYGIRAHRLPFVNGFKLPPPPNVRLEPGLYCIGATMLEHVYSPIRGAWTVALEAEFIAARRREAEFVALPPGGDSAAHRDAERYGLLRFARLCHYLRARQPDAHIGASILIYRLLAAELDATVHGSVREWAAAIESAAAKR